MVTSKRTANHGHFEEPAHTTQQPAPTERYEAPPWTGNPPQHHGRRRRTLSVGGIVIVMVVALVGYWLVKPIVTGTVDAGHGAICPECAVDQYIFYGPHHARGDGVLFRRALCQDRRDELANAASAFATAYRTDLLKWNLVVRLEPGAADAAPEGNRASVTATIQHFHETAAGQIASRSAHVWTFEVVDEDGWRVCDVAPPKLCQDLVKCDGPNRGSTPRAVRVG